MSDLNLSSPVKLGGRARVSTIQRSSVPTTPPSAPSSSSTTSPSSALFLPTPLFPTASSSPSPSSSSSSTSASTRSPSSHLHPESPSTPTTSKSEAVRALSPTSTIDRGDRFVPKRHGQFDPVTSFELGKISSARSPSGRRGLKGDRSQRTSPFSNRTSGPPISASAVYEQALASEILGVTSPSGSDSGTRRSLSQVFEYSRAPSSSSSSTSSTSSLLSPPSTSYSSSTASTSASASAAPFSSSMSSSASAQGAFAHGQVSAMYTSSPLEKQTRRLLSLSSAPIHRRIAKTPYKILETPQIQDDFYLNLVDWSFQDIVAVGLGSKVWLWNALTSQVTMLCELPDQFDLVTSVSWSTRGDVLAVGSNSGKVQLWDVAAQSKTPTRVLQSHTTRVGVLAWCPGLLATGSRDRIIFLHDARSKFDYCSRLKGHKQEVCGLRWSPNSKCLASGGNDNKLLVWDLPASQITPLCKYSEHKAAVKAIAWSPHQRGLLGSGGGTADRCIRFWDTHSAASRSLHCVDTGSQVCNLRWSQNAHELVSSHGYSQNQIVVWSHPSMTPLATLTGHTTRVLYMAVSPDGQSICTAAGDETLRFWSIFPESAHPKPKSRLSLQPLR